VPELSLAQAPVEFPVPPLNTIVAIATAQTAYAAATPETALPVTFNQHVLPILQENCQSCHRAGEIGPMDFTSYGGTRPWAKAIKSAVLNKQMPPWLADSRYGVFRNAPKLTESDIRTLVAWVDAGAPEGDSADRPVPRKWNEGWRIQPDVVVSMPESVRIQAQGAGEVREFLVANPFNEDTWVTAIEVRPGDRSVVHHAILQVSDPEVDQALHERLANTPFLSAAAAALNSKNRVVPDPNGGSGYSGVRGLLSRAEELRTGKGSFMTMEAVYAPGAPPMDYRHSGSAKLIRGGGQIRIEMHYTPNGKETFDQTRIGFTLAKAPVRRSFVLMAPEHLVDTGRPIPAGDGNWESTGEITFTRDVELVWFMPHMHLRGKDMTFQITYPDGRVETVLSARYNFNWQIGYEVEKPIRIPRGARMLVTAHHDNSANNKLNPEPGKEVLWGDLTGQEMMIPWFGVVVDRVLRPESIAVYQPRGLNSSDMISANERLNVDVPFGAFFGDLTIRSID
jgi:hypothetical protein